MTLPPASHDALFAEQRPRLFGLAYRLTGSAEDAEDAVQEAFVRLLEGGTALAADQRAFWLVRVTTNLALDALRRRKRRAYTGPWLPALLESAGEVEQAADARYDRLESATLAFLLALEALGPRQRAVLLLRDVVGAPAREVARILDLSEANVRVIHTRARRAMEAYDRRRCLPTPELEQRHRAALEGFLGALLAQDVARVEAWLAEDARTVTDSAGEYTALARELAGRARVARFYVQAARNRAAGQPRSELRVLNGLPALVIRLGSPVRRQAPLSVITFELDGDGRIARVLTVLAARKLAALGRA